MSLRPDRREAKEKPLFCSKCAGRVNRKYRGKIRVDPEFVRAYRRYRGLTEQGRLAYLAATNAVMSKYGKMLWAKRTPEEKAEFIARMHAGRDRYFLEKRAHRERVLRRMAEAADSDK